MVRIARRPWQQRTPALRSNGWTGYPATHYPASLQLMTYASGIIGTTPKALRVVPNKVLPGAAAGCVVVTSNTVPQRQMLGDAGLFVAPGDADALADMLRRLAVNRVTVSRVAGLALKRARERFSAVAVVAPLDERLRLMPGRRVSS